MPADAPSDESPLDVAIVGAGISGIGMAAHLRRALPAKRFAILEGRERAGGTWDLFRYPGVRSDSDMYTLGYAFAPWTGERSIAQGTEILAYLQGVIDAHDLASAMRFAHRVTAADWSGADRLWKLTVATPEGERAFRARFLFMGSGYYDYETPHQAAIPGLGAFAGPVLHPQFWPGGADLAGKRVAVIGSGATAVTLVPALARAGAQVTMIQRTPGWYYAEPSRDRVALALARLLPQRWAYALVRARNHALQALLYRRARAAPDEVGRYLLDRVRAELGDRFEEAAFTPPYGPWQQRLCFVPDGDFFAALRSGDARIATGAIATVAADRIVMADGEEIAVDAIVTATGLRLATLGKVAVSLDGEPVDFSQRWYYRNCLFSGVPNFAALFGYLNAAWTARVDLVAAYLVRLFAQMDAWGADTVEPHLPADHGLVEADPVGGFSSGYLERGRALIPKSAAHGPWRLSHDLLADRREFALAPIDDGHLRFGRAGRPLV